MSIRTFIAIELDDDAHRALGRLQSAIRQHPGGSDRSIAWVKPNNIHLTLKFLGDVEDSNIKPVCDAVTAAAREFLPFDFEIGSAGCFPPGGSARVAWAGLTAGADRIEPIHKMLEDRLGELGFPPEGRRFAPHLTLARIKNIRTGHEIRESLEKFEFPEPIVQTVNCLTVFQSVLDRSGPTYTPMHHADLG